jgi:signal transduction histidine kinase
MSHCVFVRRSLAWPWIFAVGAVALAATAVVLNALAGRQADPWWQAGLGTCALVTSAAVGLLIAVRRPGHRIGWLLLGNALVLGAAFLASAYAEYALLERPGALPGARWAALWDNSAWPLLFAGVTAIAFVFPDGSLPSPRWRRIAAGACGAFAVVLVAKLFDPSPFDAPFRQVASPLPALPRAVVVPLLALGFVGVVSSLLAAALAIRVRFRRATGIERLQLKWLAYGACLIPATMLVCFAGVDGAAAFTALFLLMLVAVPVSVGIAVLRFRLYDIDRLINRTIVYAALTLLLAGAYIVTTLVFAVAVGRGSAWATAGATLAVALAFRPLRSRVQNVVDRHFNRARYEGHRRVEGFLADLRAGRAAPEAIEKVLADALGDPQLELQFWLPESEGYVDARGRAALHLPGDARARTPVNRGGVPLAIVMHDPALDERPDLRRSVVEAAGLAIEIARLRVELRRQLDEVETSRARIVAAGYVERRRIERDLHDGAQQRLVSVGLTLRHAQHQLGTQMDGVGGVLDDAVAEIGYAIAELRELARGVRPSQLDNGLAPALRELAGRALVSVDVEATADRFPGALEAAAYFVASEGLTNAVKHAHASNVAVRAVRDDDSLVISITDDGVGGAAPAAGSGLAGLADRVHAQGGTLRLESAPGSGTCLTVELPCGS